MSTRCIRIVVALLTISTFSIGQADELDIGYGKATEQKLDVYTAVGKKEADGHPVVIWVHGGGWRHGDKDNRSGKLLCRSWADAGIVMVNLNYRLTPDVTHPSHVEDVAAGVAWVHENIAKHGGDPKKIFLIGHSAGAHLVALVATNPKFLMAHAKASNTTLAGVMPIDTASFDLSSTRSPAVRKMIRDAFGESPETLLDASPLPQATKNKSTCPPFLIAVVKQRPEAQAESTAFSKVLPSSRVIVMDYPQSGQLKAHGEIARDLIDVKNSMTIQLLAFVKEGKL